MRSIVALAFFASLLAGVSATEGRAGSVEISSAEAMRQHLASQGALSPPNWWAFAEDLQPLYSPRSIAKPAGCPLDSFKDQPQTASPNSVNSFVVDFKRTPDEVCRSAPDTSACLAISNNCVAVETSFFCDFRYLRQREAIAHLAYYQAWQGLKEVRRGKQAMFAAMPNNALSDLAKMSIAARDNAPEPNDLAVVPSAKQFALQGVSSAQELAHSISLLTPVLHEVAHIEQSYCGRGIANEGSDDFVARLILSGKREYAATAKLYEALTCSRLARNEFDADLRSMDMMLRYLEKEAPAAIARSTVSSSSALDPATRIEIRDLQRFAREIALMSFMFGAEYDLLIHDVPERALLLANGEPPEASLKDFVAYYFNAGDDRSNPRARGHMEAAFRTVTLAKVLHVSDLNQVNGGHSAAQLHVRVYPFIVGRFMEMRRTVCKVSETDESMRTVADYVSEAFQHPRPLQQQATPDGDRELDQARALLTKFTEEGIDAAALTRRLRPEPKDYHAIFYEPFAEKARKYYDAAWASGEMVITNHPEQTEVQIYPVSSDELRRQGRSHELSSGYSDVVQFIRPGLTMYRWRYVEPGKKFGMAYDGLYHVNGRWVLIPKVYHVR